MSFIPEATFTLEDVPDAGDRLAPKFELSSDKKVDVLVSHLAIFHGNIASWTTRSYEVVTWAVGITFAVLAYAFAYPERITVAVSCVVSVGLLLFGLVIQLYMRAARRAYGGNRWAIAKCEAALRLYEDGAYLCDQSFFTYSKELLRSNTLKALSIVHVASTLAAIGFVLLRGVLR